MTWGSSYWPIALGACAIIIFGPETYALITNWRNTLSEYSWQNEPGMYSWLWFLILILWLGFTVWITGHIFWKIWG